MQFCQSGIQPIAVIFGGHLGKVELDTVALANSVSRNDFASLISNYK